MTERLHIATIVRQSEFVDSTLAAKAVTDGVSAIVGKLKGRDSLITHCYRFDPEKFTEDQVLEWLKKNQIKCSFLHVEVPSPEEVEQETQSSTPGTVEIKVGARHSARDRELINRVHRMARDIQKHMKELGAEPGAYKTTDDEPPAEWLADLQSLKGTTDDKN